MGLQIIEGYYEPVLVALYACLCGLIFTTVRGHPLALAAAARFNLCPAALLTPPPPPTPTHTFHSANTTVAISPRHRAVQSGRDEVA